MDNPSNMKIERYNHAFGTISYELNYDWHRENGPASISADGWESWWREGKLIRENGTPHITPDGFFPYRDGKPFDILPS